MQATGPIPQDLPHQWLSESGFCSINSTMRKYRLLRAIFNLRWSLNILSLSLECHNARALCLRWRSDLGRSALIFKVGGEFEAGMLRIIECAKISPGVNAIPSNRILMHFMIQGPYNQ
jgi:hypothetical protein